MLDIVIVAVGKLKKSYNQEATQNYQKLIRPFVRLKIIEVEAESFTSKSRVNAKRKEGEKLVLEIKKHNQALVLAMTEKGREYDSFTFAKYLEKQNGKIVFVIGGALGFSDKVLEQVQGQVSLSQMTMPHEMARVVLLEQLYRVGTIITGKDYHY